MDELYKISAIREITYDPEDSCFYILVNKYIDSYGLFLIKFEESDAKNYKFLLKVRNGLEISDCDIQVMTGTMH